MSVVRCKPYHRPLSARDPGQAGNRPGHKSRCPGWASDPELQQRLLDEALQDPASATDSFGRPKILWNAVAGWVFVGVSTNEAEPAYNCYPDVPVTRLHAALANRRERTLAEFLGGGDQP